jgi:DNA polymerase I
MSVEPINLTPAKSHSQILSDIGNMPLADNGLIVLDIEGNDKDPRADANSLTLGFSYAYKLKNTLTSGYVPLRHFDGNVPSEYLDIFRTVIHSNDSIKPICHNIKYDAVAFANNLDIDILSKDLYDTMLLAHWVDEHKMNYSLEAISRAYGGSPKNKTNLQSEIVKAFGWELIPFEVMYDYSTNDAVITYELFEKLLKEFNQKFSENLWNIERDWVRFIIEIEKQGVSLDHEFIKKEIEIGEAKLEEIKSFLGGNPGSPKFLSTLLFNRLGLPVVKRTPKGKPCFDKEAMAKYDELLEERAKSYQITLEDVTERELVEDVARQILEYRGWTKALSSNYRAYLELESPDGRLRPNYKIHGTTSSRLSCEKPNLQQIPRESTNRWNGSLKKAFIAKAGYRLWEFDYSNLELRIMALYAEQENLLEQLRKGYKPFDVMAEQLGWERQACKIFTYMTGYGAGIAKIARTFGIPEHQAAQMKQNYFTIYNGFDSFAKNARNRAAARGYVKLWTGRRCHFPYVYIPEEGKKLRLGTHKAANRIVQGGAAELVKYAGIALYRKVDWQECTINLQIHDQYTAEIKKGTEDKWIPIIQETMENVRAYNPAFASCPFPVEVKEWGT